MCIFHLDDEYKIVCDWKKPRSGFKHTAVLHRNGFIVGETKVCYLNRTWERFEYQSVLEKIVGLQFDGEEEQKYRDILKTFH